MALEVQKLDRLEVIRRVQEVVNNNADNQVVDGSFAVENVTLTLTAHGGDTIEIPLTGLATKEDLREVTGLDPATEEKAGKIAIVSESEAKKGTDDTMATTARKVHIILDARNIPTFDFDNPQDDQVLRMIINEDDSITITNAEKSVATLNSVTKKGGNFTDDGILTNGYYQYLYPALPAINGQTVFPAVLQIIPVGNGFQLHVDYTSWSLQLQALLEHADAPTRNYAFAQLFKAATPEVEMEFVNGLSGAAISRLTERMGLETLGTTLNFLLLRQLEESTDQVFHMICARLAAIGCATGGTTPTPGMFTLALTHYELVDETTPAPAPVFAMGGFDTNDCEKITGWGRNPANINEKAINVIYCDVTEVARVESGITRTDVKTALSGAGFAGVSYQDFGFRWDKPARFKDGQVHAWSVRSVNGDAYQVSTPTPTLTCANAVERRFIPPVTVNEGGLGAQVQLVEVIGGQDSVYLGSKTYSLVGAPAGITINAQGIFSAAADSVSSNVFVEVHIAISNPDTVVIGQAQVINTDCQREAGTTVYVAAWNFTPQGTGAARLFSSMTDANNTAGAKFDGSAPGTFATFSVAIKTLAKGQKVYYGTSLSCELASDATVALLGNGEVNTVKKAIIIKNGLIEDIQDSTYATPSTPTVPDAGYVYSDSFTQARPNDYTSIGSTWAVSNGQICQNDANATDGRYVLDKVAVAANANKVAALVKIAQKGSIVGGVGVGLRFNNGGGYNLLFLGNGLRFLHDGVALGPEFVFDYKANTEYWFKLKSDEANGQITLSGRVWENGKAEPTNWPYTWAGLPARAGSAVLVSKAGSLGPACFLDHFVYAPAAQVVKVNGQFWFGNDLGEQPGGPNFMSFFYAKTTGLPASQKPQIGLQSVYNTHSGEVFYFDMVLISNPANTEFNWQQGTHNWGTTPSANDPDPVKAIHYWVRATPTSTPIRVYIRPLNGPTYTPEMTLYPAP